MNTDDTDKIPRLRHDYIHAFGDSGRGEHRCSFLGSNRCTCGRHRAPEPAVGVTIAPMGTARERLKVML